MHRTFFFIKTLSLTSLLTAELYLPKVIHDHMVLQRNAKVPVWGWDTAGQEVAVTFGEQTHKASADESGKWMVELTPLTANATPQSMTISGSSTKELKDILVGEVWLASGQSNMEWSVNQVAKEGIELAQKHVGNTQIRTFHVSEHTTGGYVLQDNIGKWKTCQESLGDPTVESTSAVGFFFAQKLHEELNVPIGILDINWGGMAIECFIPDAGYEAQGLTFRSHNKKQNDANFTADLERKIAHFQEALKTVKSHGVQLPIQFTDNTQGWAENMIYKTMIAPSTPFAIQGAIWYQGESNRGRPDYHKKLLALQAGLSEVYRKPNLPLYQVQIAPYAYTPNLNDSTLCDTIWTAQYKAADEVESIEVIPSHDTKINIRDIHPQHKLPIGKRLAEMALNRVYNRKDIAVDAPRVSGASLQNGKIVVSFTGLDKGLVTSDGLAPSWFEESVDGKTFSKVAVTEITGETVTLTSALSQPVAHIRMGWTETAIPNLKDKNGLPVLASPSLKVQ